MMFWNSSMSSGRNLGRLLSRIALEHSRISSSLAGETREANACSHN